MKSSQMLVLLLLVAAIPLAAQSRFEMSDSRSQNLPISYEAVPVVNADSSDVQVDIHYRIGENFFIFVRDQSGSPKAEFTAHGELAVELLNEQKVSVARQIRQLPLSRTTIPKETDRSPSLEGVVPLTVPPGTYTIVFSVDDHESGRTFMEKTRKVTVLNPKSTSMEITGLMFVQPPAPDKALASFTTMNRGGDVLFADAGGILTELLQPAAGDSLSVRWTIDGRVDGFGEKLEKQEGTAFSSYESLLQPSMGAQGVAYSLMPKAGRWKVLFIPLPLAKLEPGMYHLAITYRSGMEKKEQTHQFRVIWPSRPFSLIDPDLAVDALRYIATDSVIDAMQSGSAAQRANAFYQFWQKQDHDTTTAYNVAMAEYYYRVDEAMRKFSTSRENDGYKTDRGRIYILYGPPPKFERLLDPNSPPTEIWTYENIHRRFRFIDPDKTGNYILNQAENL